MLETVGGSVESKLTRTQQSPSSHGERGVGVSFPVLIPASLPESCSWQQHWSQESAVWEMVTLPVQRHWAKLACPRTDAITSRSKAPAAWKRSNTDYSIGEIPGGNWLFPGRAMAVGRGNRLGLISASGGRGLCRPVSNRRRGRRRCSGARGRSAGFAEGAFRRRLGQGSGPSPRGHPRGRRRA